MPRTLRARAVHHARHDHDGFSMQPRLRRCERRPELDDESEPLRHGISLPGRGDPRVTAAGDSHERQLGEFGVASADSSFKAAAWRDHVEILVVPDAKSGLHLANEFHDGFGLGLRPSRRACVLPVAGLSLRRPIARKVAVQVDTIGVASRVGHGAVGVHRRDDPQVDARRWRHRPQHVSDQQSGVFVAVDDADHHDWRAAFGAVTKRLDVSALDRTTEHSSLEQRRLDDDRDLTISGADFRPRRDHRGRVRRRGRRGEESSRRDQGDEQTSATASRDSESNVDRAHVVLRQS